MCFKLDISWPLSRTHFLFMAAFRSRCGHYIFIPWFLLSFLILVVVVVLLLVGSSFSTSSSSTIYFCPVVSFYLSIFFIPRLISAVAGWMSTILVHMM